MIAFDLETGEFFENYDIKEKVAKKHPFGKWIKVRPPLPLPAETRSTCAGTSTTVLCLCSAISGTDVVSRQQDKQTLIKKQPMSGERVYDDEISLVRQQVVFGWSSEDMEMQIADMASTGKETTFCMGDDAPLAVLSEKPHVLYNYFKQRFAQV